MFYGISCMTDFRNRRILYEKTMMNQKNEDKQPLENDLPKV